MFSKSRKFLRALLISALAFGPALSAPPLSYGEGEGLKPHIDISGAEYDFGHVTAGTKVQHDFVVKNTGTAPLDIQRVVAACGCTATSTRSNSVAPGASTVVKAEFDTTGFSGEKFKAITVYSNDPDQPSVSLALKGTVESDVKVSPRNVIFSEVVREQEVPTSQEISVDVREGSDVSISGVKTFSKYLHIKELESGAKHRRFSVSIDPQAPLGELRERVIISLLGKTAQQSINVPIFAAVKGRIRVSPATVSFGVIEGKETIVRSIKLENLSKNILKLGEIESDNPALKTIVKPIKEGKIYVVELALNPALVEKDLRASINIPTNIPEEKLLVSVYGVLPPKL